MIKTFSDKSTAAIFAGKFVKTLQHEIQPRARERLDQVHSAAVVDDLRLPPSNQLEALKGDRKGQWSVRINRQWRVCFRFEAGNVFDVEITDYHQETAMTINIEDLGNMDFSDVATGEAIQSVRPGVFLRELLDEFGLSQTRLAVAIGVSAMRISHIIKGSRPITAEIALRFGLFFGQSPQYWLNLQTRYDMECATSRLLEKLRHEIAPLPQAA